MIINERKFVVFVNPHHTKITKNMVYSLWLLKNDPILFNITIGNNNFKGLLFYSPPCILYLSCRKKQCYHIVKI